MSIVFLNGWGLSVDETLRAFDAIGPWEGVRVVQPTSGWREALLSGEEQCVYAYSLGAFLMINDGSLHAHFPRMVFLAPFSDFKAESGKGGTTREAQLKYLLRWLARDPLAAVNDFRRRAGCGPALAALPQGQEDLVWGIEQLLASSASVWPTGARGYIGSRDPLLDAAVLQSQWPQLQVVEGVGHGLADLLNGAGHVV